MMQSLIALLNAHQGWYIALCYGSLAVALGLGVRALWPAWLAAAQAGRKRIEETLASPPSCSDPSDAVPSNSRQQPGYSRPLPPASGLRPAALFLLALGVAVVLFRLPVVLTDRVLNPDECLQIVGGWSFLHDPVPWRGSDNGTSGPFNMYVLTAALAVGLPAKIITARLVMVALGLLLIGCTYFTLLKLRGQLAAVPAAAALGLFVCFIQDKNHAHYNSEALSVALLAAALLLYVLSRPALSPSGLLAGLASSADSTLRLPLVCASGLLLGALPYAKLQAAPLGCFWALVFAIELWRNPRGASGRWPGLLALGLGGVSVPLLMTLVLAATGTWHDFVMSYFGLTQNYGFQSMPFVVTAVHPFVGSDMPWFLLYCLAVVAGPFACVGRPFGLLPRRSRIWLAVLLCYLAVAVLAVIAPRTGFPHYAALVLHPIALLLGIGFSEVASLLAAGVSRGRRLAARIAAAWLLAATVALIAAHVCGYSVDMRPQDHYSPALARAPATGWVPFLPVRPRETSPIADFIAQHARPGDRMSVWGWAPNYYLLSGVRNATREVTTITAMAPTGFTAGISDGLRSYYRERYLKGLQRTRPAFFVDAVSGFEFICKDRRTLGHETWPDLARFVAENYAEVLELAARPGDGTRVYTLKERVPAPEAR